MYSYKRFFFFFLICKLTCEKSYNSVKFKSHLLIYIMNDLHLKIYNYMKRNTKIQPRHILTNAIFALSFSSSAI